jgi:hypothetical protein
LVTIILKYILCNIYLYIYYLELITHFNFFADECVFARVFLLDLMHWFLFMTLLYIFVYCTDLWFFLLHIEKFWICLISLSKATFTQLELLPPILSQEMAQPTLFFASILDQSRCNTTLNKVIEVVFSVLSKGDFNVS